MAAARKRTPYNWTTWHHCAQKRSKELCLENCSIWGRSSELTSRSIWQACFAISVDEMVTRSLISKGL